MSKGLILPAPPDGGEAPMTALTAIKQLAPVAKGTLTEHNQRTSRSTCGKACAFPPTPWWESSLVRAGTMTEEAKGGSQRAERRWGGAELSGEGHNEGGRLQEVEDPSHKAHTKSDLHEQPPRSVSLLGCVLANLPVQV